jgi:hypothetical protein
VVTGDSESGGGRCTIVPKKGYESPKLLERMRNLLVRKSFKGKPKGSNSMVQLLCQTNLQTIDVFDDGWGDKNIVFNERSGG